MFRPLRKLGILALALAALASEGCKTSTLYTNVYSPKRQRFTALPEKKEVASLPESATTPSGLPESAPPAMPGMPIPEAAPAPPPVDMTIPGMAPEPAAPLPI